MAARIAHQDDPRQPSDAAKMDDATKLLFPSRNVWAEGVRPSTGMTNRSAKTAFANACRHMAWLARVA